MVPVDHQRVAPQRGRAALAVAEACGHVAEVDLPEQLAVERVGERARGAEVGVQTLAVGDRRRGGPARFQVMALVRRALSMATRRHASEPSRRS